MRSMIHRGFIVLGLVATGCGGSGDTPPLGTVTGTVTMESRPLAEGRIEFVPAEGGRTSTGNIEEGQFTLIYSLDEFGAKIGRHTVKVSTQNEFGGGERVADEFNVHSQLTAEVKPGANEFTFEVKPRPPRDRK